MMTLNLKYVRWFALMSAMLILLGCDKDESTPTGTLQLVNVVVGSYELNLTNNTLNNTAPIGEAIKGSFSAALNPSAARQAIQLKLKDSNAAVPLNFSFENENKTFSAQPQNPLEPNETYILTVSNQLRGTSNESFPGVEIEFSTIPDLLSIASLTINGVDALNTNRITDVSLEGSVIEATFSVAVDPATIISQNVYINGPSGNIPVSLTLSESNTRLSITTTEKLRNLSLYLLVISNNVKGNNKEVLTHYTRNFYTAADPTPDFPVISDEDLLTLVQEQTFKYFYDFAHSASGMARERNTSGDVVTTGGTGFGIMAIVVAIERNFITRQQGLEHFEKILTFLETADRFHGAWSHWVNGNTGKVYPFSANDNGGDLVETSFLVQGLLTFRQYLNPALAEENELINRINTLWQGVEWDWYTREGQKVLYWHWSPDKQWAMNHQIRGYNEALITYVLAASSPTHAIEADVYHEGWGDNGGIINGESFYDINLPVGFDYGGPLFFAHYSFLGIDPRNLSDTYANYWTQNVNHSLINHAYVVDNPRNFVGYRDENWGLTASDNQDGYSAHSPTNDLGVISPTAALSSFPYTPEESMKALKFFYYTLGDRLWGTYGFYDAFNLTEGWVASSYLAIDQGPIVVMIENHRTGLLWDLFMSAPEVQAGLTKLSFTY